MCCIAESNQSRLSRRNIPVAITNTIVQVNVDTVIRTIVGVATEKGEAQRKPLINTKFTTYARKKLLFSL